MARVLRWAALLGCLVISGHASEVPGIRQLLSLPFASNLIASPDHRELAWTVDEQGRHNVWVASAPEWEAHQITSFTEDDGAELEELAWSRDSRMLAFTRGADFETAKENPNPTGAIHPPHKTIWIAALTGGTAKPLGLGRAPSFAPKGNRIWFLRNGQIFSMGTDGSGARAEIEVQGTATDLTWSPDGHALAFTDDRGDHSFIALYRLGGNHLEWISPTVDTDSSPVWSASGQQLAFLRLPATSALPVFGARRSGPPWSIEVYDCRTEKTQAAFQADAGRGSVFREVSAEKQLFWTASGAIVFPWEKNGWLHLYEVFPGQPNAVDLSPGAGEVEHVSASGDIVTFSSNIGDPDRRHIWVVHLDKGNATVELTTGTGIEYAPVATVSGTAFLASSYDSSAHVEVRSTGGKHEVIGPARSAPAFAKPESVVLRSADGVELHAQLFVPAGSGKHPAVVFFHGGSRRQMLLGFHPMYYYSNAYAMNQFLAQHGYVVLSVNYRSGIGYGMEFREALNYGASGASEFADVVAAARYLGTRPDVDASHIGAWGGSYGGYLTALALAKASNLYAAGVDFHGVHDWNIEFPQSDRAWSQTAFGSSPLAFMDTWKSPVLLIHGDDDRTVPFTETVQLVQALRSHGVPFQQLIFPNEVHQFLLWRDWVKAYDASADFLDHYLR